MAATHIADWMTGTDEQAKAQIATDIAASIDEGGVTIGLVVQSLEIYLKQDEDLIGAANALELFSEVLLQINKDLPKHDVHIVIEYLNARLENKDSIPSYRAGITFIARSLKILVKMGNAFAKTNALKVASAVFSLASTGSLRDQKAATRLALLDLLECLVETREDVLIRDMKINFVEKCVSMAEFEKDPVCLQKVFQIYNHMSRSWDLNDESLKQIWESFVRYFPITLGGKAKNATPSPEQLQQLLSKCFSANNYYAEVAVPMLLELLDYNQDVTANVKRSALETLALCINEYNRPIIIQWYDKVWDAVKFEIWNGSNDELIDLSLKTIFALNVKLSPTENDWTSLDEPSAKLISTAIAECADRLDHSDKEHIYLTGRTLQAIAVSSCYSFNAMSKKVIPIILNASSYEKKGLLLGIANIILQSRLEVVGLQSSAYSLGFLTSMGLISTDIGQNKDAVAANFLQYRQALIDMYSMSILPGYQGSLTDKSIRLSAIEGVYSLCSIPDFINESGVGELLQQLNTAIFDKLEKNEIREKSIQTLQIMANEVPSRFQNIILPSFMNLLPSHVTEEDLPEKIRVLSALIRIACKNVCSAEPIDPALETESQYHFYFRIFFLFAQEILKKLTTVLENIKTWKNQGDYATVLLASLCNGLKMFEDDLSKKISDTNREAILKDLAVHPYKWIVIPLFERLLSLRQDNNSAKDSHKQVILKDNTSWYIGAPIAPAHNVDFLKRRDLFIRIIGTIATDALCSPLTVSSNNFALASKFGEKKSVPIWALFCRDIKEIPSGAAFEQEDLCGVPEDKSSTNYLTMSLLAGIQRQDKDLIGISSGSVAAAMLSNAASSYNQFTPFVRTSILGCIQLLVNKFGATNEKIGDDERSLLSIMLDIVSNCVDKSSLSQAYQTMAYFTAASLACMDGSTGPLVTAMIDGIKSEIGRKVAQSFQLLLAPSDIINSKNLCVLRPLRKQRLYAFAIPELISLYRKSLKRDYLIAIAFTLKYMDTALLVSHASEIFPLVLEGTNVDEPEAKLFCVEILARLIPECSNLVEEHLDSIIARMTDRTRNTYHTPSDATAKCRVLALHVLLLLTKTVQPRLLLRKRGALMMELDFTLDDIHRDVRHKAEQCKMAWKSIAGNDGEDN